jgi:hypothetical protein
MKIKKPSMVFETYAALQNYIQDTENIDEFIVDAVREFTDKKELESVELDLECKEINKIMKVIYERHMIEDVLNTVMQRYLDNEEYEKCVTIRDLLNKLSNSK